MLAGIARPLTTSVGTSVMPRSLASFIEDSTDALVAGSAAQAETLAGSSPAFVAALFSVSVAPSGVLRPSWPSNTAAAYWKNAVLPPILLTQTPYWAAFIDCGWIDGMGLFSKTMRALGKSAASLSMLACASLQCGHWKSANSTSSRSFDGEPR